MILLRVLNKEQIGIWALFLIVTAIFEASKSSLIKNAHIKFLTTTTDDRVRGIISSSSFLINLFLSLLFIVFILVAGDVLGSWLNAGVELRKMLWAFIPGVIAMVQFSHFEYILQANLDFKGVFWGYFVRQLLFFLGIVGLVFSFNGQLISLVTLVGVQVGSLLVGTFVMFRYVRKYLYFKWEIEFLWVRKIIKYGGYIFGSGLMANFFSNLDQIMSAKFMSPVAVSSYNVAARLNQLVDIPSYSAAEVAFPKVSQASTFEGMDRVKYIYERMVSMLLSFSIPASLFVLIFPKFVISIIAGAEYYEAVIILQLYMISSLFRPIQNQAANIFNSIGRTALCFWLNTASFAVNILANYICLKLYGFYGIAIGTLLTILLTTATWYWVISSITKCSMRTILSYTLNNYKVVFGFVSKLFNKK